MIECLLCAKSGHSPLPLICIDANFFMFPTQANNDVITSVTENITNIDAMIRQNRAIRLAVIKNILSIFTPI